MNEEKYYYGVLEFYKDNKSLDTLHSLNKLYSEEVIPKSEEIERLMKLVITLSKSIQELSCNEEELELLNSILGSDKE